MSKFSTELATMQYKVGVRDSIRQKMDEESYKDFEEALANLAVTAVAITNALKAMGIDVSENTIRRWRKML